MAVGTLAAHIWAGDDQHAARVIEAQVVGDEGFAAGALDHRMAPAVDQQHRFVDQFRLCAIQSSGALGEAVQHVDLRDGGRGRLQRRQACGQMIQQGLVQRLLARQGSIAGSQHFVLEGFQFGSDESFGGFHRLAAQVVCRHPVGLTAAHLDEKALYSVEAQFQAGQAGALAFLTFEVEQELLGVAAEQAQLVEFGIVAGGDHAAVAHVVGGRVDDGLGQQGVVGSMTVLLLSEFGDEVLQQGGGCLAEELLQPRQDGECRAQLREVPRPRRAQGDSRDDSLQVADGFQRFREWRVLGRLHQRRDRLVARAQGAAIAQRPVQPTAQHSSAHGGRRTIEDARQSQLRFSDEALVEFQVAAGRGVHDERGIALFGGDRQQVR